MSGCAWRRYRRADHVREGSSGTRPPLRDRRDEGDFGDWLRTVRIVRYGTAQDNQMVHRQRAVVALRHGRQLPRLGRAPLFERAADREVALIIDRREAASRWIEEAASRWIWVDTHFVPPYTTSLMAKTDPASG